MSLLDALNSHLEYEFAADTSDSQAAYLTACLVVVDLAAYASDDAPLGGETLRAAKLLAYLLETCYLWRGPPARLARERISPAANVWTTSALAHA